MKRSPASKRVRSALPRACGAEHLFTLRQSYELWPKRQALISQWDEEIAATLRAFETKTTRVAAGNAQEGATQRTAL